MKTLYKIFIFAIFLMAAQCRKEPEPIIPDEQATSTVTYSDLVIENFNYDVVSAEGGTITPVLTYKYVKTTTWSDGRKENETLSEDATVSFSTTDNIEMTDNGIITLPANEGTQASYYSITVTITVGNLTVNETVTMIQDGTEDRIISVETVQLPIELKPHTAAYPIDVCVLNARAYSTDEEPYYLVQQKIEYDDSHIYPITYRMPWETYEDENIVPTTIDCNIEEEVGQWYGHIDYVLKREIKYESHSRDGKSEFQIHWYNPYERERNIPDREEYDFLVYTPEAQLYESVSASGVDIEITGGQLATITTYLSGRQDTIIVKEPVFTTETSYKYWNPIYRETYDRRQTSRDNYLFWYEGEEMEHYLVPKYIVDEPENRPVSEMRGNMWSIHKIGAGNYLNVVHTLTARIDDKSVSMTLRQNPNFIIGYVKDSNYIEISDYKKFNDSFQGLPDYEDFPYGSSPKWAVNYDENGKIAGYSAIDGTRNLHPDERRALDFRAKLGTKEYYYEYVFLNGETAHYYEQYQYAQLPTLLDVTLSIEGDVPLGNGNFRHMSDTKLAKGDKGINHRSDWQLFDFHGIWGTHITKNPETSKQYWKWYNKVLEDQRTKLGGLTSPELWAVGMLIPTQKDAIEDFEWTITLQVTVNERGKIYNDSHASDYIPHSQKHHNNRRVVVSNELKKQIETPLTFTIIDKKLSWEEFSERKQIGGFLPGVINQLMVHCLDGGTIPHSFFE